MRRLASEAIRKRSEQRRANRRGQDQEFEDFLQSLPVDPAEEEAEKRRRLAAKQKKKKGKRVNETDIVDDDVDGDDEENTDDVSEDDDEDDDVAAVGEGTADEEGAKRKIKKDKSKRHKQRTGSFASAERKINKELFQSEMLVRGQDVLHPHLRWCLECRLFDLIA